jgi:hypothetical protein
MSEENTYADYRRRQRDEARREGHLQRLGEAHPVCTVCGYARPEGLVLMRRDALLERGLLEQHSLEGRHEGLLVPVCRNHHAELSDEQYAWDSKLRTPDRDGPTRLAALLRGLAEFLMLVARELRNWSERILREGWSESQAGGMA